MKKLTALLAAGLFAGSVWAQSTVPATSTTSSTTSTTATTSTAPATSPSMMDSVSTSVNQAGSSVSTWTHKAVSEMQGDAGVAFASEYTFRGKKWGQSSIQPTAMIATPVCDGTLYAKTFMNFPIDQKSSEAVFVDGKNPQNMGNELDFSLGYKINLPWMDKLFSVDAGYTYYYYPTGNLYGIDRANEIYLGAMANVILNPTLYAYYDWNREQFVIEANISYSFDLGEHMSANGFFVDLGATLGGLWADKYAGDQLVGGTANWKNSYAYWGAMAGLRYMINSVADISLTLNYAGNNDGSGAFVEGINTGLEGNGYYNLAANVGDHENLFWWGVQTRLKF